VNFADCISIVEKKEGSLHRSKSRHRSQSNKKKGGSQVRYRSLNTKEEEKKGKVNEK